METEPQIIDTYVVPGDVKLVYRHLLQLGDLTERAAIASECAAEQGQFWKFRTALYRLQQTLYGTGALDTILTDIAADTGLDRDLFITCLANDTYVEAVRSDFAAARREGVQSRPVFDINGQRLVGAQSIDVFTQIMEEELAK